MLLIDTDMLVLLAVSGLLDRVAARLGYEMKDVRRLDAATHQIRKSKSLRDQYGSAALDSALPRIQEIAVVEPAVDTDLLDRLNDWIDPGEALLVAVAAAHRHSLLISGDKRAIRQLARCGDESCIQSMQGRIVTLEAVLWILLKDMAPRSIHPMFMAASFHKTLRVVFSRSNLDSADGCIEATRSYFISARAESAGLLYDPDPGRL